MKNTIAFHFTKGYFHSTISMHILRIGFFSVKQYKALTGFSGTLGPHFLTTLFLSCVCISDVVAVYNAFCQMIDK